MGEPDPAGLLAVWTTVATRDDAARLAAAVVDERLAACAQVDAIESWYRWDGAVRHEPELRLLFKTRVALWPALQARLLALHPYEVPAIFAVEVPHASRAYADWVAGMTGGEYTSPL